MKINKRFQDYVNDRNFWKEFRKEPIITFPLSQADVDDLGGRLSGDLSPENLACDGEISQKQVGIKFRRLNGVVKDIEKYCDKNNLHYPRISY